jgi:hypothetical protein
MCAFFGYVFISSMMMYLTRTSDVPCKDIGRITIDLEHIKGNNLVMILLLSYG